PALEGFLLRIENGLRQQLQTDFAESRIGVHTVMLDEAPADRTLDELLGRCKVSSHPELARLPA
ncbi:MAG TPA: PelD GGDEF domain-containing protein, partial [Burkholderiaceae bacterium]|nr:PelD GGDEF domain-containing protein [Burkholderiaceae bacterium]